MQVGILTSGGDCPGLNAVIRAAARQLHDDGHVPVGLLRGYRGLGDPRERMPLADERLAGILQLGGTILQSSGYDPYHVPGGIEAVWAAQEIDPLDAVIAIGGEHTMWVARRLSEDGLPVVGVPKTIDNDVVGTDRTFGFDTAVQVATDAIDRLRTTAQSHDRVMVVEVMGRNSGWIAATAGIAGGADLILVPEVERPVDEVAAMISARHGRGKTFSIIVVAEGARLSFADGDERLVLASDELDENGFVRLGGIGTVLGNEIDQRTGFETRVTVLGHVQRGGTPVATDRVLATRFGLRAAELVHRGETGRMVALQGTQIGSVPLAETEGMRTLDLELLAGAARFFG
jgi:ATP-dependent phosphofructokinase / diphosphate-dependent phosphofructokinase